MARLTAALALVAWAGCSSAGTVDPHNHCATDRDCTTGRCDTVRSMCVGAPPAPLQIGLEIAVPATGASGGAIFPVTFTLSGPGTMNLSTPRPITVAGTVRQAGRADAIPADLVFTPMETIPGRPGTAVRVSTTAVPADIGTILAADYVAQLAGHTRYFVRIEPTGPARAELPPLDVDAPVDTPDDGLWEQRFTYPAMLDTVRGDLVNAAGDPLAGLFVQAVDAATESVVLSSRATSAPVTDPRPGSFTLVLAPGVTAYHLRVSASTTTDPTMPVPTFSVDPTYLYPSTDGRARILVPDTMPVTYRAQVARADTGAAVTGATVQLEARGIYDAATGVTGSFRAAPVTTDGTGMFEAVLVPGTYKLVVVPGSGSDDLGVLRVDGIVLDHAMAVVQGALFEVPTRATFGGTITTVDGHVMTGATVQATPLGAGCADPAAPYARSATASTDPLGHFHAPLDVGAYDVVAQPPSTSGYAWTAHSGVSVCATGVHTEDFTLEPPVPLSGVLTDAMGTTRIAGAEIRAFGVIQTIDGTPPRSVAIGRVTTDTSGHYMLLLPPSF